MIRLSLTLMVVAGLSGVAFAQGSTGRRGFADPNYVVTRTVSESIVSVDLVHNTLVLKNWDGKPHMVKIAKETKFPAGPQTIALHDLHAGEWVRYTYRLADSTAVEIRGKEPPPAPPRKWW